MVLEWLVWRVLLAAAEGRTKRVIVVLFCHLFSCFWGVLEFSSLFAEKSGVKIWILYEKVLSLQRRVGWCCKAGQFRANELVLSILLTDKPTSGKNEYIP